MRAEPPHFHGARGLPPALWAARAALLLTACGGSGSTGGGTTPTQPSPDQAPTANLSVTPDSGYAPLSVEVKVTGTDPDGSVAHYKLDTTGNGTFDVGRTTAIDTTLSYQATMTLQAQVVDDQGKPSATVSHQVSVKPTYTRSITLLTADPGPGTGTGRLAGGFVITWPQGDSAHKDTLQADGNGQITAGGFKPGTYVTQVRDELGVGPGLWNDLANPDTALTVSVQGDTAETYILLPVLQLPAGNTEYTSGLDFIKRVVSQLSTVFQGVTKPVTVWIDPDSALNQASMDSVRAGILDWDQNGYNLTAVVDSASQAEYTFTFVTPGQTQGVYRKEKYIKLDDDTPLGVLRHRTSHEITHVLGNLQEAKNSVGVLCSQPATCSSGVTLFEQQAFTAMEKVKRAVTTPEINIVYPAYYVHE